MAKRLAVLNVVALGVALALFVWANTRTGAMAIARADSNGIEFKLVGSGWPVRVEANHLHGFSTGASQAEYVVPNPDLRQGERIWAWLANGSVGLLLVAALAVNARQLFQRRPAATA